MTGTEFPAETRDGEWIAAGDTPQKRDAPPKKVNLHDLEAVRREMSRVYRDMRSETIEAQQGTRLVYVLERIAALHQAIDVDRRLQAMERVLKGRI